MQGCSGYRLAAKQRIAVKVVAEFLQEAKDISDTADRRQSQCVLLLVKEGWREHTDSAGQEIKGLSQMVRCTIRCYTWKV